eukprot:TRINITY_DN18903_c0_g1_i1.p1 TRINITY_DN18903_c0_g1~~TRINITY_DN18903_c0_g1_i1.p1  ORF type:complete len:1083 (+),score=215.15 TRINITY_DN18903_c0_g1_i1:121-3369(+)
MVRRVKKKSIKTKVVKRAKKEELPATLASNLLGTLLGGIACKEAVVQKGPHSDSHESALDQLADCLFGLDLETIVQSLDANLSNSATIYIPEDGGSSFPFEATPQNVLSLYRRVTRSVLSIPLPPHLSIQFDQIFNYFPSGAALLSTSQSAPNVTSKLVVVKSDDEGGARSAFRPSNSFEGKNYSVFVVQVDGLAEWGGHELDSGDVCYIPSVSGTLDVTSVHGCASIVISFCWNTVSELVAPVCYQLSNQINDGVVSISKDLNNLYNSWGKVPNQYSSDLLQLCREYQHHAECYLKVNQPAESIRSPLLPGTLFSSIKYFDFHNVACETLSKLQTNADCGINYQNRPNDPDQRVASFSDYGVAAFDVSHKGGSLDDILSLVQSLSGQTPLSETDTITERHPKGFFPVHYRLNRQDMGLEMTASKGCPVRRFMKGILDGGVGEFLKNQLGTKARLVELSCLLSHPGAKGQPPHSDSTSRSLDACSAAHLISVFVPLVNVTDDMGPLEVWPRTHSVVQLLPNSLSLLRSATVPTGGFREYFSEAEEQNSQQQDSQQQQCPLSNISINSIRATVSKGHAVCMDSRLYHRGSANNSNTTRPVFYFTFASEEGELPEGSTYSLLDTMKGKVLFDYWKSDELQTGLKPLSEPDDHRVMPLPVDLSSDIQNHLHDGNTKSIIQRLPPSTVRGATQQQVETVDILHDHLVDVQEFLIKKHNDNEAKYMSAKGKTKTIVKKKNNGILAALEWVKNTTEKMREDSKKSQNNGLNYIIHGDHNVLTPCEEDVAIRAEKCGQSVCISVGSQALHSIKESSLLSDYHSVNAKFLIIKPSQSSHNLTSGIPPQTELFLVRCTSNGLLKLRDAVDLEPLTQCLHVRSSSFGGRVFNTSSATSIFLLISAKKCCPSLPVSFITKREIDPSFLRESTQSGWGAFSSARLHPVPKEGCISEVVYFIKKGNDNKSNERNVDINININPLAVVRSVSKPSELPPISGILSEAVQTLLADGALSSFDLFVVSIPTSSLQISKFVIVSDDEVGSSFLKELSNQPTDCENREPTIATSLRKMIGSRSDLRKMFGKLFLLETGNK